MNKINDIEAGIRRLLDEVNRLRSDLKDRENDCRILLAQLDFLQEAAGEGVESEDRELVDAIRRSLTEQNGPET